MAPGVHSGDAPAGLPSVLSDAAPGVLRSVRHAQHNARRRRYSRTTLAETFRDGDNVGHDDDTAHITSGSATAGGSRIVSLQRAKNLSIGMVPRAVDNDSSTHGSVALGVLSAFLAKRRARLQSQKLHGSSLSAEALQTLEHFAVHQDLQQEASAWQEWQEALRHANSTSPPPSHRHGPPLPGAFAPSAPGAAPSPSPGADPTATPPVDVAAEVDPDQVAAGAEAWLSNMGNEIMSNFRKNIKGTELEATLMGPPRRRRQGLGPGQGLRQRWTQQQVTASQRGTNISLPDITAALHAQQQQYSVAHGPLRNQHAAAGGT